MKKTLLSLIIALVAIPGIAQFSIQKVVFEEFTGAWCQYCADGAYRAQVIDNSYPDALITAVHVNDAMQNSIGQALNTYYSPAFPQGMFNRSGTNYSRGVWSSTIASMLQGSSIVTVSFDSVAYNPATRQLTVVLGALFTGNATGDLRFNLLISEDSVTGTGSGYNQVNADNNTPGHPYQGAGNPIVGFVHKHVLRAAAGGTWGTAGVIPTTVGMGTRATHTYTTTLSSSWNVNRIGLIGLVSRYDGSGLADRKILNGEEMELSSVLVVGRDHVVASEPIMDIHGNPLVERSKILFTTNQAGNVRVEVLNVLGQHVATLGEAFMDQGAHTLYWNGTNSASVPVDNGIYLIRLITEHGQSITKRVMVAK